MVARFSGAAGLFALVLLVSLLLTPKTLEAQEPAVLTCAFDNTQPLTDTQLSVTCSLIDNLGVAVADTPLTFYVNFEAGTDVAWENGRKTVIKSTDGKGQVWAVLDVGKKPGNLGILANYPGIYSSYTFVRVEAAPNLAPALDSASPSPPGGEGAVFATRSSKSLSGRERDTLGVEGHAGRCGYPASKRPSFDELRILRILSCRREGAFSCFRPSLPTGAPCGRR